MILIMNYLIDWRIGNFYYAAKDCGTVFNIFVNAFQTLKSNKLNEEIKLTRNICFKCVNNKYDIKNSNTVLFMKQ